MPLLHADNLSSYHGSKLGRSVSSIAPRIAFGEDVLATIGAKSRTSVHVNGVPKSITKMSQSDWSSVNVKVSTFLDNGGIDGGKELYV